MKRFISIIVTFIVGLIAVCFVIFGLIQLIPYGRDHSNPPVWQEPNWDSPQTRQLAQRACFDCHSNETVWPWYSQVAPMSWLVYRDVVEGREKLNFSEWGKREIEIDEVIEVIQSEEMPLRSYVLIHPSARLTAEEKALLIQGLQATLGIPELRDEESAE